MPDTLLVGVDGSDGGARAVNFAAKHAKDSKAKLVVAYVIEWSPYSFNTPQEKRGAAQAAGGRDFARRHGGAAARHRIAETGRR